MKPVPRADGRLQYDITVRSAGGDEEVYRTHGLLGSGGGDIISRGTLVWKAVRLDHGVEVGEPVALKDVWVDDWRPREGSIHAKIIEEAQGDPDKERLKSMMLTVLIHGDVAVEGAPDRTRVLPGEEIDVGQDPMAHSPPLYHRHMRVHYRIVFKEVCKTLAFETSANVILKALADMCYGGS